MTNNQAASFLAIASASDSRLTLDGLAAVAELPKGDRWPVLAEFARAARARMTPAQRAAIDAAVAA